MRIILHPSLCPNSVLRACALRLFAGVGPPLRALFCCPAAPGGWNPGAKTGGTDGLARFFVCAGGAPDLSAAMTRPCLRDAGTYDFRTKWLLIFFQKIAIPSFSAVLPFCRPAVLPSCRPPPCRPAVLPPCRPLPCHLAALLPCRPPPADSPERRMPFPRPPLGPGKIRLR